MKYLCTVLVIVALIAGICIGATVFITRKLDTVVDAFDAAGNKFDAVLKVFECENVNGISRQIVNPDNIIKVASYAFPSGKQTGGIQVDYDKDGVITANGKVTNATAVCLGEKYVLKEGYYTFCINGAEPTPSNVKIRIVRDDGSVLLNEKIGNPVTVYNDTLCYVKVYIDFAYGEALDGYKFAPVLVAGTQMGTFYTDEVIKF